MIRLLWARLNSIQHLHPHHQVTKKLKTKFEFSTKSDNKTITAAPAERPSKRITIHSLQKMKQEKVPITMVTAYEYPSAVHVDVADIDILLVGDR